MTLEEVADFLRVMPEQADAFLQATGVVGAAFGQERRYLLSEILAAFRFKVERDRRDLELAQRRARVKCAWGEWLRQHPCLNTPREMHEWDRLIDFLASKGLEPDEFFDRDVADRLHLLKAAGVNVRKLMSAQGPEPPKMPLRDAPMPACDPLERTHMNLRRLRFEG